MDDVTKQDGQQTIESSAFSIAEAVLAAAAGTAFFYRIGGERYASSAINRMSFARDLLRRDIAETPYRDWFEWGSAFKNAFTQTPDITRPFTIRPQSSGILDSLVELYRFESNPDYVPSDVFNFYNSKYIAGPVAKAIDLSKYHPDIQREAREFIYSAAKSYKNPLAIARETARLSETLRNDPELISDITKRIYANAKSAPNIRALLEDESSDLSRLKKSIYDQLSNTASLRSSAPKPSFMNPGTYATVQDIVRQKNFNVLKNLNVSILGLNKEASAVNIPSMLRFLYQRMGAEWFNRMRDVSVLDTLKRTRSGNIYSTTPFRDLRNSIAQSLNNTMPARLFKGREFQYAGTAPQNFFIPAGSPDAVIADFQGSATGRTLRDITVKNGRYFEVLPSGELSEIKGAAERWKLTNANVGFQRQHYVTMGGYTARYEPKKESFFKRFLDYGHTPRMYDSPGYDATESEILKSGVIPRATFQHSELAEIRGDNTEYFSTMTRARAAEIVGTKYTDNPELFIDLARRTSGTYSFFQRNTYALDASVLRYFRKYDSPAMSRLYDALYESDLSRRVNILTTSFSSLNKSNRLFNPELARNIREYSKDPRNYVLNMIRTVVDKNSVDLAADDALLANDIFTSEISKEIMARVYEEKGGAKKGAFTAILKEIDSLDIPSPEKIRAKHLLLFTALERRTGFAGKYTRNMFTKHGGLGIEQITKQFVSIFHNDASPDNKALREEFIKFAEDRSTEATRYIESEAGVIAGERLNNYVVTAKTVTPFNIRSQTNAAGILDAQREMNTGIKRGFLSHPFFNQFRASSTNMRDFSYASSLPHFFFSRLNDSLNTFDTDTIFGRRLSFLPSIRIPFGITRGTDSTWGLAKGLFTRRVLPFYIGYNLLDWANDTMREQTGMSGLEAEYSGAANISLFARKVSDAIGTTSWFKKIKEAVPFLTYYGGDNEYMSADEYRTYLRRGYDPVRRGRYWLFGSANEARGANISYWRANALRRETANAYDKSLYGSYDEKWSHSLIPTPSHPLSPLRAILDPYWLERKHYMDRPYPITGPFFEQGTPWGAILNPTLGELIKPVRKMHESRLVGGIDIKAVLASINNDLKRRQRAEGRQHYFIVQNGRIVPMAYMAFNAPTDSERVITKEYRDGEEETITQGEGEYVGGVDLADYESSAGSGYGVAPAGSTKRINDTSLSVAERLAIATSKQGVSSYKILRQLGLLNATIKMNRSSASLDLSQGIFIPDKFRYNTSEIENRINSAEAIEDALNSRQGMGFVHDSATTLRMLSGIYGYMAQQALGDFGEMNRTHIATSQDMTGYSRHFWDQDLGGFGGEFSEIARRIIPNYGRYTALNPLMNTMPDWLPERFRFGDPFASVPNGEERLPGVGYEALNQLHPDMYGKYGALDRMKILGDIAPFSAEYKFWKTIAKKTAQDERSKAEYDEIRKRVNAVNSKHDFYDYKFIGRSITRQEAIVTEVLPRGHFKIEGSDEIYSMAGITVKSVDGASTKDILSQYLSPGKKIILGVDSNEHYRYNKDTDRTVSAAVYVHGENISERMVDDGAARFKASDTSAAATIGRYGVGVTVLGTVSEILAHAPIPLFHSQFARIDTPLESYLNDQVYGTPYQSWSAPWSTFIKPGIERAISTPGIVLTGEAVSTLRDVVEKYETKIIPYMNRVYKDLGIARTTTTLRKTRNVITWAETFTNRGAFIGNITSGFLKLGSAGSATFGKRLRSLGRNAVLIGALGTSIQDSNPIYPTVLWAKTGYHIAKALSKYGPSKPLVGAAVMGVAGFAAWSERGAVNKRGVWIPDRIKDKWAMNEYFDRLTYIKMTGLYHKAAREARDKEGVDVERFFRIQERDQRNKNALKEKLLADKKDVTDKDTRTLINKKLSALSSTKTVLRGGPLTQSAILYKQAADATMYGLPDNASMTDILRALPSEDRDYFTEMVKERDHDKREEILRYASPQLGRALRIMWKMDPKKPRSNMEYFRYKNLPGPSWKGWSPDIKLSDVKAKTVKNEGLLFSDFGIYESAYRRPEVINAPVVTRRGDNSVVALAVKYKAVLEGMGLTGVDVNVEPSASSGISVVSNIYDKAPTDIKKKIDAYFENA